MAPIKKKEQIISYLYDNLKPIKNLKINNLSYNTVTLYSYFHNDIIKDMENLWATESTVNKNYLKLKKFIKDELEPFLNNLGTIVNDYNDLVDWMNDYYIWYNYYNNSNYYTIYNQKLYSGDPTNPEGHTVQYYLDPPKSPISVSSISLTPPTMPTLDPDKEPIYEMYTYTWLKDKVAMTGTKLDGFSTYTITYEMPYKKTYENGYLKKEISYNTYIQNYWQTLSYSYMEFCNNRYENHMSLIM